MAGRSVAFDAKSTLTGEFNEGLPDNQVKVLKIVHQLQGLAGILLGFQIRQTVLSWWIPWPIAQAFLHGVWTPDRVADLPEVVIVPFVGYIDFLGALEGKARE